MSEVLIKRSFEGTYNLRFDDGHCTVNAGIGKDWITVYLVITEPEYRGQGEATRLLKEIKDISAKNGRTMRLWCPLDDAIVHICKKLNIETIDNIDG